MIQKDDSKGRMIKDAEKVSIMDYSRSDNHYAFAGRLW
jgi:hypothetical protein